jgi:hypothetical protein
MLFGYRHSVGVHEGVTFCVASDDNEVTDFSNQEKESGQVNIPQAGLNLFAASDS